MIGIYKITSPSKRVYIGQSVNIKKRINQYKKLSNCSGQTALFRSLKKYGHERHVFDILEECSFGELNIKERYYQELFEATGKHGLNLILTKTDVDPQVMSMESRMKISLSSKGRIISKETRKKMSIACMGRRLPKVQVDAMKKPVYCFDLNGVFIKKYDSLTEARLYTGASSIMGCLRGREKTSGGMLWSRTTTPPSIKKPTKSGYRGVTWNNNGWVARCEINDEVFYIGKFSDPISAAIAYNDFIISHNLCYKLNIIQGETIISSPNVKQSACGYKGVHKNRDIWRAGLMINGKVYHIGMFITPELAAIAYNNVNIIPCNPSVI
jgi:group I intron endonuclease